MQHSTTPSHHSPNPSAYSTHRKGLPILVNNDFVYDHMLNTPNCEWMCCRQDNVAHTLPCNEKISMRFKITGHLSCDPLRHIYSSRIYSYYAAHILLHVRRRKFRKNGRLTECNIRIFQLKSTIVAQFRL